MSRRPAAVAATVAVLTAVSVAVAGPAGAEDPPTGPLVLTYTLDLAKRGGGFVDNPPRNSAERPYDSPGDYAILAGPLTDASGRPVGAVNAVITTLAGSRRGSREQLSGVLVLPDGQLAVQGVFASTGRVDVVAITGGTGAYRGARGEVTSRGNEKRITFVASIDR